MVRLIILAFVIGNDEVGQGWDGTVGTVAFKAEAVELGEGGEVSNAPNPIKYANCLSLCMVSSKQVESGMKSSLHCL